MKLVQVRKDIKMQWDGSWISRPDALLLTETPENSKASYFRKVFNFDHAWQKAVVHICGVGFYELYLNGKKVKRKEYLEC